MHEYMAQVDQNYVDAWKNGGKVDGKAVTDARLIAHLKSRRDDLDTDDPKWAEWDNRVTQYTFAIEDSKMQVKYDTGKASDGDMARFYARWAAKTPDNTEFQRTLLSAAGKFRAASARKGRASADAAGRDKFASDVKGYEKKVTTGMSVADALVTFANETGIGNNAKWLTDIDVAGGGVSDLMDVLKDGSYDLDENGDLNIPGYDVAAKRLTEALKTAIPGFTWKGGLGQISGALETAASAASKGAKYVKGSKYGTKEWANYFGDSKVSLQYTKTAVDNLGPKEDLRANLEKYNEAIEDAHGNPFMEDEALTAYLAANKAVGDRISSNTTGNIPDPIVTGINNEARNLLAISQGDTNYKPRPDWIGDPNAETKSGSDKRFETAAATATAKKLLEDGGWLSVEETVSATGTPVMTYVVWPKEARQGTGSFVLPGSGITGPDGVVYPVYTAAVPIQVNVYDQNNNRLDTPALKKDPRTGGSVPVRDEKGNIVTNRDGTPQLELENPDSGVKVIPAIGADGKGYYLYQTTADDGSPVITLDPPVVPGVTAGIRISNGKPVLDYRVDPTMVKPDGKTNVTGEVTAKTGPAAGPTQQPYGTSRANIAAAGFGIQPAPGPSPSPQSTATGEKKTTGPAAGPSAGLVATQPGWFPADLIDRTITNKNPITGRLNTGAYESLTAAQIDHDLTLITPTDPQRVPKLTAITDRIANAQNSLQAELDAAVKRGDTFAQRSLAAEFRGWQNDLPNIQTVLTITTTGEDPGKLTSPSNPVNQFFAGVLSAVGFTTPKNTTGAAPDVAHTLALGRTADADSNTTFARNDRRHADGTPVVNAQNSRALKLPDVGATLPFLKPLTDFISQASVPQLAPGTITKPVGFQTPPATTGLAQVAAPKPTIGPATPVPAPKPADLTVQPAAPKPPAPPPPATPFPTPQPTPVSTPKPTPTLSPRYRNIPS